MVVVPAEMQVASAVASHYSAAETLWYNKPEKQSCTNEK